MSDRTTHGPRAGTKTTKVTKITNETNLVFVILVIFVAFVSASAPKALRRDLAVARTGSSAGEGGSEREPSAVSRQTSQAGPPPTEAQQRPVFRGGTHFVRVDVYPTQNGQIVEGLKPEDFEVLEDGKPQAIESFDFVRFDTFTPEAFRQEPRSQQEGFDMAADPRNRVFVIVVDLPRTGPGNGGVNTDIHFIQQPLISFLDRVMGAQDLFGFLTSRNTAKDLVLARKTGAVEAQIRDMFRAANIDRDEADDLDMCANDARLLKGLYRDDQTYTALETLVGQLGAIREERKSVIFVANSITRAKANPKILDLNHGQMPRVGVTNGRIGIGNSGGPTAANETFCTGEVHRLAAIDFDDRYRQLVDTARHQNVTFYTITPEGLTTTHHPDDNIIALAHETDGIAIVNTNDLTGGMKTIADDIAAYYVLGYYTTNTKFDGGIRKISVRLKGNAIRARREYRAPTEAEIAAMASATRPATSGAAAVAAAGTPREAALTILERAGRPFVPYVAVAGKSLTVIAELSAASIQAGRWKDGADVIVQAIGTNDEPLASAKGRIEAGVYSVAIPLTVGGAWPSRVTIALRGAGEQPSEDWVKLEPRSATLVGEAIAYRASSRSAPRPVAAFAFARNERIRAEWPVLAPIDRREMRLLDRSGKPLPVELPLSEDAAKKTLVLDMSLSGLPRGDYLIELTAGSGAAVERRLLAIRIKP
jgi:VWFA-related protein